MGTYRRRISWNSLRRAGKGVTAMCDDFFNMIILWGVFNFVFLVFSVGFLCSHKERP